MAKPMTLVDAARMYLSAGLTILALRGKAPNTAFHSRGILDAIHGVPETEEDEALLVHIFEAKTTTGIGIAVTYPYFVVDVDGEEGAKALRDILGTADISETPAALTGRGLHIWFADTTERRSMVLGEKLDLKGVGGYVAAPPSLHPDGHVYRWLNPLVDEWSGQVVPVMELPEKLERFLTVIAKTTAENTVERVPTYLWQLSFTDGVFRLHKEQADADMTGLAKAIISAPDGKQNSVIMWAAATAQEEGVPFDAAYPVLMQAARDGNHPEKRAHDTITGAYRRAGALRRVR